jgi:hypothetical protein
MRKYIKKVKINICLQNILKKSVQLQTHIGMKYECKQASCNSIDIENEVG